MAIVAAKIEAVLYPPLMKRALYLLLIVAIFFGWRDWSRREIVHPPGILVPDEPRQSAVADPRAFEWAGFRLSPRAQFDIRARVLSREDYRWDDGSDLSPVDLALGWGAMSDQSVLERIEISQGARWYYTRYDYPAPLPDSEIIRSSGNMHMVPANEYVRRQLKKIRPGHLIHARGLLVDAEHSSGFRWRTSLSRLDTGNGACELFYVERLYIEN
jgi:hypothetical protein